MKEAGGGGDGCGFILGIATLIWDCYVLKTAPVFRIFSCGIHHR